MPIALDLSGAESFVQRNTNARWDNYTLVLWKPDPRGFTNKNGAFRNGQWGVEHRVEADDNGVWRFNKTHVR